MRSYDKRPPRVPPITRIELTDDKRRLRIVLLAASIAIAIIALAIGLTSALTTEPGWQVIEPSTSELNCSRDFVLNYYLGAGELSATQEHRQLRALYGKATEKAYLLFNETQFAEQSGNLAYVSAHPNETVAVDPVLYHAFSQIQAAKNRCLYLGPVYIEYERVFHSETDVEAESFDPAKNAEQAAYVKEIAAFANDPAHIDLELLGDSKVRLNVSDAYLACIGKYELTRLLDFAWMKNAFIVDYLAQTLLDQGFSNGYLASFDGFTRNLDTRGEQYTFNLFNREGKDLYLPAAFHYKKATSIVYLRDYPMSAQDDMLYYMYDSGESVTTFVDPADGMQKNALHNLVSYSENSGCAQLLLQISPVYLRSSFSAGELNALTASGTYSIWFNDRTLCYNQKDVDLQIFKSEDATYTASYAG